MAYADFLDPSAALSLPIHPLNVSNVLWLTANVYIPLPRPNGCTGVVRKVTERRRSQTSLTLLAPVTMTYY